MLDGGYMADGAISGPPPQDYRNPSPSKWSQKQLVKQGFLRPVFPKTVYSLKDHCLIQ